MLCIYNSKHPEELSRISFCLFLSLCFSLRLAPTSGPRQEVYLLPNSKCKQVSKYGNMTGARCRYVVPHELQITSIDDRPSLCSLLEPHHRLANQLAWVWSICSRPTNEKISRKGYLIVTFCCSRPPKNTNLFSPLPWPYSFPFNNVPCCVSANYVHSALELNCVAWRSRKSPRSSFTHTKSSVGPPHQFSTIPMAMGSSAARQ